MENSVGGPGKVMENSAREKYDWRRMESSVGGPGKVMENSVGGPGKVMENSVREKYAPSDGEPILANSLCPRLLAN